MMDYKVKIEKWIDVIFKKYKQKTGDIILPVDEKILLKVIEELKGIKIKLEFQRNRCVYRGQNEGIVIPIERGFILKYGINPYNNQERIVSPVARRRFTICHELAHILFYDCSATIPKLTMRPPEHVCHRIAREMLLPVKAVKEKFYKEYRSGTDLIPFLRKFAYDAKVSLYPLAKRLTEELSLIDNSIVTFWRYIRDEMSFRIRYSDYRRDSKLCPELKKLLPYYWRHKIYLKAWKEVVEKVAKNKTPQKKSNIIIEGKKKRISFDIECEVWAWSSLLRWTDTPVHLLSLQKIKKLRGLKIGFK
jgi:hypothetical protein